MEFLCDFYDFFMSFYGIAIGFLWDFCGISRLCVRDSYGIPMGFLWDIFAIYII